MPFYGRGKNKIQNPYTVTEIYKKYKKEVKGSETLDVPYKLYREIVNMYFKEAMNFIFDKSLPFKLPCNLGTFQIIKKKEVNNLKKIRFINWKDTTHYGKYIFYSNDHSDDFKYYFMWIKDGRTKNISKYRYVPTRTNKRKLAYYIKNKIRDYFEVS